MTSHRSLRAGLVVAATAVAGQFAVAAPSVASAHAGRHAGSHDGHQAQGHHGRGHGHPGGPPPPSRLAPQVVHTGTGPTGYQVTFHYYDPSATSVRIRGEWFFSSPQGTTTSTSEGLTPDQWQPGDFPIANPNHGAAPNWPVADMTFDAQSGVWSYTTPMPSGTFTYGFYVDCSAPAPTLTGCTELSDPSNAPWNTTPAGTTGSVEPDSEVYVPSDPRFGTQDLSFEQPHPDAGRLLDVAYPDPQSLSPAGSHPLAVFLPPAYDPHRHIPYPTLYLSHGAGGNEVDWSTQGAANSILVNLMQRREVQPMVIVMTDFNGLATTCGATDPNCYVTDVTQNVIPFVQSHFDVSTSASARAFGGLSAGGQRANELLFNATSTFGYLASWSIADRGAPPTSSPLWQNPQLKSLLGLAIGGGMYDSITEPGIATYESELDSFGIPFTDDQITGGHEWYTWRQLLFNDLTKVAFRDTTTSVRLLGHGAASAVVPDTAEPEPAGGTVQFAVDGQALGRPVALHHGRAIAHLPRLQSGATVTASYSGDSLYAASTSAAVTASGR